MRNNMRNIARFLFRILFFFTSCEKKKTAEGALRRAIYQTHSEILWSYNFKMGMVQSRGDAPYPFYLVIQHFFFYELKRNLFDDSIAAFHILLHKLCHPIVTDDFAKHIRIQR